MKTQNTHIQRIAIVIAIAILFACKPTESKDFQTIKVIEVTDEHTVKVQNISTGKALTWKVENAYSQGYEAGQTILIYKR